jgi:hypothetical protein
MRATFATVDELLEDLKHEAPGHVFQRVVRMSMMVKPVNGTKRDAVKFQVSLHVSAVVQQDNGDEYIAEVSEDCGCDYHDATQDYAGTEMACDLKQKVKDFCDGNGLTVRPGIIEM